MKSVIAIILGCASSQTHQKCLPISLNLEQHDVNCIKIQYEQAIKNIIVDEQIGFQTIKPIIEAIDTNLRLLIPALSEPIRSYDGIFYCFIRRRYAIQRGS